MKELRQHTWSYAPTGECVSPTASEGITAPALTKSSIGMASNLECSRRCTASAGCAYFTSRLCTDPLQSCVVQCDLYSNLYSSISSLSSPTLTTARDLATPCPASCGFDGSGCAGYRHVWDELPPLSCRETCADASDGDCDDGGEGAQYTICELGTDCTDCGASGREAADLFGLTARPDATPAVFLLSDGEQTTDGGSPAALAAAGRHSSPSPAGQAALPR